MIGGMMGIHWYVSASFVYGFGVLFVPILETFGWSRSVGSLTALFMQPVGGAVGPLIGAFVDRHGARPVAIGGVVCSGLGIMSLAFMQALWMLFLSFSLVSIGMSSTMGVGFNTAIVNWFRRQRGKALGMGFSGGALSGPFVVVVVWLEATYGWRESALILGAGMILARRPVRDADPLEAVRQGPQPRRRQRRASRRDGPPGRGRHDLRTGAEGTATSGCLQ